MGNQQPTGRTRSDTYTRYERDGEDGRYVTLDHSDSVASSHAPSFDDRVKEFAFIKILIQFVFSLFRQHLDMIRVHLYVFVIKSMHINIILNILFMQMLIMRKRQSRLYLNIQHHQKIKKLY